MFLYWCIICDCIMFKEEEPVGKWNTDICIECEKMDIEEQAKRAVETKERKGEL